MRRTEARTQRRTVWSRGFAIVVPLCVCASVPAFSQCPDGTPPPCAGAAPAARPAPNAVAVLYFDNLSRDTSDAYLADGLTEDIIARLGEVQRLQVKSRYVSRHLRTLPSSDPSALGRQVGVSYLVTGSLRHSGDRVKVVAELVRAATGNRVWGTTLERSAADVLAVEADIAQAVATGITGRLLPSERARLARQPTRSPAAYDLYLRAHFLVDQSGEQNLREAIELYHRAIRLDTTYALAYAGISSAWNWLQDNWLSPREALPPAREAAARALALDSLLPEAHAAYGSDLASEFDFADAERELRRALELGPNSEDVGIALASLAIAIPARLEEGLAAVDRILAANPYSVFASFMREGLLYYLRRYDDAIVQHGRVQALDSTFFYLDAFEGAAWREKGQFDSALAAYRRAARRAQGKPLWGLGVTLARMGRPAEAHAVLDSMEVYARRRYLPPSEMAFVHLALGERDSAFADFERAYDLRDSYLWSLDVQPFLDPVRTDLRFVVLRRRNTQGV